MKKGKKTNDFGLRHRQAAAAAARKANARPRGMISGTTEHQYTDDELEFLKAVEEWKKRHRRLFPAVTELLRVAAALGYRKPGPESYGA